MIVHVTALMKTITIAGADTSLHSRIGIAASSDIIYVKSKNAGMSGAS